MGTLRDDLLPVVDELRGIAGELGLRQFTVSVLVRTWSGGRVGLGTKTDTTTSLTVAGGTQNPRVVRVSQKDIVASGNLYQALDLKVGPLTPPFSGGGTASATLDPASSSTPTEIFWKVTGPGLPSGGGWFAKIADEQDRNFGWFVILRASGKKPG